VTAELFKQMLFSDTISLSRRWGRVLSVAQAAARLGVSGTEVRRLVHTGTLAAERVGSVLVVDETSVETRARQVSQAGGRGRALAPSNAWAVLWEVSGRPAEWLTRSERSRLRAWLTSNSPEHIAHACRARAARSALRVLPAYRTRVLDEPGVVRGGWSAADSAGADVTSPAQPPDEIYCTDETLARLRRDLGLSARGEPNLTVRVPRLSGDKAVPAELAAAFERLLGSRSARGSGSAIGTPVGTPLPVGVVPVGVVAVDLIESDDVRTRRAGLDLLQRGIAGIRR
jgi:excisionase family DNA binding protein